MGTKNKSTERMMLDVIQNVIKGIYIPADQENMVETCTNGRQGSMSCHIDRKNEEVLLCKFDQQEKNSLLFPYFEEVHGFVSMCDYILFVEDDSSLFVFLVDLKDSRDSAKPQTMIAQTFAEFIINRIKTIIGRDNFPKPVEYRKIGVKTTNAKMTTKGYEKMAYDPDGYVVLPDYHKFYTRRMMDLLVSKMPLPISS